MVSTGARFICKEHPRNIQLQVVGREYDPLFDDDDSYLHFQSYQFDKKLDNLPDEEPSDIQEFWATTAAQYEHLARHNK
jgi:hypothetical protein